MTVRMYSGIHTLQPYISHILSCFEGISREKSELPCTLWLIGIYV